MSLYETHKEAIRKYCSRKWDEHELKLSYREDYDNWHVKTISNKNITASEYEKLYQEWWGNKIKEARQLLKEMKISKERKSVVKKLWKCLKMNLTK